MGACGRGGEGVKEEMLGSCVCGGGKWGKRREVGELYACGGRWGERREVLHVILFRGGFKIFRKSGGLSVAI